MNYQVLLQNSGLHAKEALVYLTLLETGAQNANFIARKAKVERANVYYHLENLREKGLVTIYTEGDNTTFFKAEPPESITRYLDREQAAVTDKIAAINNAIPELEALAAGFRVREPKLRFYQTRDAVQSLYEEIVGYSAFKAIVNIDQIDAHFPKYGMNMPGIIKEHNITAKELVLDSPTAQIYRENATSKQHQVKLLDPKHDHETDILIFGENVAFISYGDHSVAFVIEDERTAKAQDGIFNALWEKM